MILTVSYRQNTCPSGEIEAIQEPKSSSSFITDISEYMDFCKRPELMGIVSFLTPSMSKKLTDV
jgi:hypothetical protein